MIACSMPGCQTTAGCQCHLRFPYYPPQAPTLTTGGTGANLSDFAAGRLAGLREAAEVALEHARNYGQGHEFDDEGKWTEDAAKAIAAAILALAERGEGRGMSRYKSSGSTGHAVSKISCDDYRLHWVVDRYYPGSRLRHPRPCYRDTDKAGAIRFAKRWGCWKMPDEIRATLATSKETP